MLALRFPFPPLTIQRPSITALASSGGTARSKTRQRLSASLVSFGEKVSRADSFAGIASAPPEITGPRSANVPVSLPIGSKRSQMSSRLMSPEITVR